MPGAQILGLVLFALLLSAGQILFKSAAQAIPPLHHPSALLELLRVPVFWLALTLYGSATLLWIYLLQIVPISRAYPFAVLGFVFVPAAGILFFGESVTPLYIAGMTLILIGILAISQA